MTNFKFLGAVLVLFVLSLGSISVNAAQRTNIIFDTDMGNDVDDVMAMDLLLKYHEAGKINLLAVMGNRQAESCCAFIDMYDTWFGYPNIPIGQVINGSNPTPEEKSYATKTLSKTINGKPMFKTTHKDQKAYPNAVDLYRKILAKAKNKSVVIVSVGFSSNLSRLMETTGDEYSPLNGMELLKKKVSYISVMAANFLPDAKPEYNVWNDVLAARKLFTESPVPLIFGTFDLGKKILYPGSSVQNDFKWTAYHPFVVAYESYKKMPYDRPTWDPISALFAIEPNMGFFSLSEKGNVAVDDKGGTVFTPDANGKCRYLITTPEQNEKIKNYFVKCISRQPKHYLK